jgi:hypothetical protein
LWPKPGFIKKDYFVKTDCCLHSREKKEQSVLYQPYSEKF